MSLRAYRICKATRDPFDGTGAATHGGRWNSPGRPVVYCSLSFAGALLEILAHAAGEKLPGPHHMITLDIPEAVARREIDSEQVPGWNSPDALESRMIGDAWLDAGDTAILIVPSAVAVPHERNLVINPAHPDVRQIQIGVREPVIWDPRLLPRASISVP